MLPALCPHRGNHSLHRDDRPQHVEVEDFVEKDGIDLLYRGRVAASCIVYQPVDAAVVSMHSAYGFLHAIKLRHVYRDGQASRKPLRQFLERISTAGEEGDFPAAIGKGNRGRKPDPRRSAGDNEDAIFDLHGSMLPDHGCDLCSLLNAYARRATDAPTVSVAE
jgi:hypothetical protein